VIYIAINYLINQREDRNPVLSRGFGMWRPLDPLIVISNAYHPELPLKTMWMPREAIYLV